MELNWELNALEETDVVSLVLLLVTRSVGDILVSYLCLQFQDLPFERYESLLQ